MRKGVNPGPTLNNFLGMLVPYFGVIRGLISVLGVRGPILDAFAVCKPHTVKTAFLGAMEYQKVRDFCDKC